MLSMIRNLIGGTGIRWSTPAAIFVVAMLVAVFVFGWTNYVLTWVGVMFKAVSGAFVGFLISRTVFKLDLSKIPEDLRPQAALSQAILVAGFAIAVSMGV